MILIGIALHCEVFRHRRHVIKAGFLVAYVAENASSLLECSGS